MILPTHIYAKPIPGGYSWTLTSRLGEILREIQSAYGERDMSYTLLGIEYEDSGPRNWFPGNCKNIAIQLGPKALMDDVQAYYQLAHEAVHLLAPSGGRNAPVLEEGLAEMFSQNYVFKTLGQVMTSSNPAYNAAAAYVREMIAKYPEAISSLRAVEPAFYKMSQATFQSAHIELEDSNISLLVSPFSEFKKAYQ